MLKSLIEKRNKLMADMQSFALEGELTAERRAKIDAMLAESQVISADITRVQAFDSALAESRSIERPGRPNPGESHDEVENVENRSKRQKAALRSYMRTGVVAQDAVEHRDLLASAQGIAIPVAFNPQVIAAQKSWGALYDIVDVVKTDSGEPMKYVLDDDTSNGLTAVTSGTDASETDPTLSGRTLQVDNFTTGLVKVDMALLQDAGFDIDAWVRDKFAKRFFRGASSLIYNGDSANVTALSSTVTSSITTAVVSKLGYADFATAYGTLDPAYQPTATWAMNNSTLGGVIALTDTNGRPLFIPNYGDASNGFAGSILGRPVKLVTQLPNVVTGNVAVLFGDFYQQYAFRQVNPGIGILRLNERYAAGFEIGFVAFARVGGISKAPTLTTTPQPVIGLSIH